MKKPIGSVIVVIIYVLCGFNFGIQAGRRIFKVNKKQFIIQARMETDFSLDESLPAEAQIKKLKEIFVTATLVNKLYMASLDVCEADLKIHDLYSKSDIKRRKNLLIESLDKMEYLSGEDL